MIPHWPVVTTFLLALLISGCGGFLGPHKINIQQGNVITQEMVNKLKPGMTQKQVKFVLGTPLVVDTLNDEQWHYIYSLRLGNGQTLRREFTVIFSDGELSQLSGDYKPNSDDALAI